MSQEGINVLIVEKAKAGKRVVRLKGGDPYIFGRGGEEGVFLHSEGIDFETIPGISSSTGGLAYAGIPVTYREIATSFHVITGHMSKEANTINFPALAQLDGTLIFLMGIGNMEKITQGLIMEGKSPQTPAAIVYEASTPRQKVEVGTLETITSKRHAGEVKPGIIVVGEVIEKRDVLDFFSKKPLFGKKIIITRASQQNSSIVEKITELGGIAVELPTIQIESIQKEKLIEKIDHLAKYQHIIFTSQNAVKIFFDQLFEMGLDLRHLAGTKITSIGAVTAKTLGSYHIKPDITCLGKIIGGGMPVGAYGGKKEIMSFVSPSGPVYQAGTLSGNPVAMKMGLNLLRYLKTHQEIYQNLEEKAIYLEEGFKRNFEETGVLGKINRVGCLLSLFFNEGDVTSYQDVIKSDSDLYARYFNEMLNAGIMLPPAQFEAMFLSEAHTIEQLDYTVEAHLKALKSIAE